MLALQLSYLLGRATATEHTRYGVPEWPPHPARLFFALVAAHHESRPPLAGDGGGPEPLEREALLWLEQQPPPTLLVPRATVRGSTDRQADKPTTHYVPVNDASGDAEDALPEKRMRQARTFPSVSLDAPEVFLLYSDSVLPGQLKEALEGLVARVTAVGHSSSLVRLRLRTDGPDEAEAAGLEPWMPDPALGQSLLRVPDVGLLEALEQTFHRSYPPQPVPQKGKRVVEVRGVPRGQLPAQLCAYRSPEQPPPSPPVPRGAFSELVIFQRTEGPRLPLAAFAECTQILRRASMAVAEEPSRLLSGHAQDGRRLEVPHVAFIPLPDCGHEHARGHLLGLAAVLPAEISSGERRDVLGALAGIETLTFGRAGAWTVERLFTGEGPFNLMPETWTRASRVWASVTPVVLDRFPKDGDRLGEEAEATVARACVQAGLPEPVAVVLNLVSLVQGVPPAPAFPVLERPGRGGFLHVHAVLTFDQPVGGPVLIGAGRYRGYGLCRPMGRGLQARQTGGTG